MDATESIELADDELPNTFVDGRNAFFYCMPLFMLRDRAFMTLLLVSVKPIFLVTRIAGRYLCNL